jgi:hypothetical protein
VCVRQRTGEPVSAQARQLPRGLPPPFNRGPRTFLVSADDVIALRSMGAF